jgi:hypothetical protein
VIAKQATRRLIDRERILLVAYPLHVSVSAKKAFQPGAHRIVNPPGSYRNVVVRISEDRYAYLLHRELRAYGRDNANAAPSVANVYGDRRPERSRQTTAPREQQQAEYINSRRNESDNHRV